MIRRLHTWLLSLPILLWCTSVLPQQATVVENMDDWFELWTGYKHQTPVSQALVAFEAEKKKAKNFGTMVLPSISAEQVLAGMLEFAHTNPKFIYRDMVLESIKSRSLPKGSLLYYSGDDEIIPVKGGQYQIDYFIVDLYLCLDRDNPPLSVGGKWRKISIFRVPIAVTSSVSDEVKNSK